MRATDRAAAAPPPADRPRDDAAEPPTPGRSDSDGRAVKVVPKGLRSFDRARRRLLPRACCPAPGTGTALPESLRFWKTRIEPTDPDADVPGGADLRPVGLRQVVAGEGGAASPAGAGTCKPVYIEATPEGDRGAAAPGPAEGVPRPAAPARRWSTRWRRCGGAASCGRGRRCCSCSTSSSNGSSPGGDERHGAGRRPPPVRRRARPGGRAGARRLLDGGDPVHEGPGDPPRRGPELGRRRPV